MRWRCQCRRASPRARHASPRASRRRRAGRAQAARSLLVHERGGKEPDAGAMKTKVRRLYDSCNVLTSLRMIEKVKLAATCKPLVTLYGL